MSEDFAPVLTFAAALCAVMAIVWAFRIRTRGWRAVPMLLAFLSFGVMMMVLRTGASQSFFVACAAVLFVLLVIDAMLRIGPKREEK